jgi:hypothetical protein
MRLVRLKTSKVVRMNRSKRVLGRLVVTIAVTVTAVLALTGPAHAASSTWQRWTADPGQGGLATISTTWSGCTPIHFSGAAQDALGGDANDVVVWAYMHECNSSKYDWINLGYTYGDFIDDTAFIDVSVPNMSGAWLQVCLVPHLLSHTQKESVIPSSCAT